MRLKDFGSKQCTQFDLEIEHLLYLTGRNDDSAFLFKITDAGTKHVAPQKLCTGRTLAYEVQQSLVLRVISCISHKSSESVMM